MEDDEWKIDMGKWNMENMKIEDGRLKTEDWKCKIENATTMKVTQLGKCNMTNMNQHKNIKGFRINQLICLRCHDNQNIELMELLVCNQYRNTDNLKTRV